MPFTLRRLCAAATLFLALPAAATFHLWSMDELYSNADGSVQFLEMTALTSAQQFFRGHSLQVTQGATVHTFTAPADLPGDSGGHRMIFATRGFAALGIVTPDYIVPDGFFFQDGGTIDWGSGADRWTYPRLPADGSLSLNRNLTTAVNSPTNFAGQSGTIAAAAPAPRNYQALWWKAPAQSESGWGVNITHQGDILFATWFTYDTDGSGMWLVMSNGARTAPDTYAGAIYRTTGPAFNAPTFDASKVTVTQVGNGTFAFTDADNGTFTYTVNGVTQSKAITRQVFSSPVASCAAGGSAPATPNYQDLWWRSPAMSESGWGVNITQQGDILFGTWFTYGADNKGMWLVMSSGNKTGPGTYTGDLFRTAGPAFSAVPWDGSKVTVTRVGSATFAFTDANNGTFTYTVDGVTQSKPITRQVYSSPATVCR
jgi:hypothetical protein